MRKNKGFTIIELVIVIAVISILASVLIPTLTSVIEKAEETKQMADAKNKELMELCGEELETESEEIAEEPQLEIDPLPPYSINDNIITLNEDIALEDITEEYTTIDLNGFTLTQNADLIVYSDLTIKGVQGSFKANSGYIILQSNATLTIESGAFESVVFQFPVIGWDVAPVFSTGRVEILGGVFGGKDYNNLSIADWREFCYRLSNVEIQENKIIIGA